MILEKPIQHHLELTKFVYFNDEGKFCGVFSIIDNEIWDVVVFRRFRGNNYAEKMLGEFMDENPGKWTLYVNKENIPARKTYERLGFEYVRNLEIDFIELLEMKINKENYEKRISNKTI